MALKKFFFNNFDKPFIIAEIASAHLGKVENLIYLLKKANNANSDAIKFQIFKTENFVLKNNDYFKILKKLEFSYDKWQYVFNKTKNLKIKKICEIYEYESLIFAHKSKYFDAYKISSSSIYDNALITYISRNKLPLIINISGMDIKEIKDFINKIKNKDLCLMLGYQNFPTKIKDINLNKLNYLKKIFKNISLGYADHTDANMNFLSQTIPLMAISMGANVIEKHINIDRSKKKNDYYSSLNPNEFKTFVYNIKNAYLSIGNKNFIISNAEKKYLNFAKQYLVAKKDLKKGQIINKNDITFKRINKSGIDGKQFKSLKSPRLNKNIKEGNPIQINDII